MKAQLLMAAAGFGTRLGSDQPKALVDLAGKPLLVCALERFASLNLIDGAVIVVPPTHEPQFTTVLDAAFPRTRFSLAAGGAERQISVANGLAQLDRDTEIVVIHDAARPFITPEVVSASIKAAAECGAATVAIPSIDTILQADTEQYLLDTPDRQYLWACQTPQTFRVETIRQAHEWAIRENHLGTDDASLVQRMGGRVRLVMGTRLNFKVTTPTDLALAHCVVREGLA